MGSKDIKPPLRILITGSRVWSDKDRMYWILFELHKKLVNNHRDSILIHGGAKGADLMAKDIWEAFGRPTEQHLADWDKFGKGAGFVRNAEMVKAGAHLCVAFIKDESKGATMCADLAEKAGIKVVRFTA